MSIFKIEGMYEEDDLGDSAEIYSLFTNEEERSRRGLETMESRKRRHHVPSAIELEDCERKENDEDERLPERPKLTRTSEAEDKLTLRRVKKLAASSSTTSSSSSSSTNIINSSMPSSLSMKPRFLVGVKEANMQLLSDASTLTERKEKIGVIATKNWIESDVLNAQASVAREELTQSTAASSQEIYPSPIIASSPNVVDLTLDSDSDSSMNVNKKVSHFPSYQGDASYVKKENKKPVNIPLSSNKGPSTGVFVSSFSGLGSDGKDADARMHRILEIAKESSGLDDKKRQQIHNFFTPKTSLHAPRSSLPSKTSEQLHRMQSLSSQKRKNIAADDDISDSDSDDEEDVNDFKGITSIANKSGTLGGKKKKKKMRKIPILSAESQAKEDEERSRLTRIENFKPSSSSVNAGEVMPKGGCFIINERKPSADEPDLVVVESIASRLKEHQKTVIHSSL